MKEEKKEEVKEEKKMSEAEALFYKERDELQEQLKNKE